MQKPTLPIPSTSDDSGGGRIRATTPTSGGFAGRYEILSRLGVGGMAEVVLARDRALGRLVALKLLAPALAGDPMFVERFRREATAIAALNHPGVVVIYDHGVADGQPYIAMEYVAGRTLKQIIADNAPLAPGDAIAYACQVLDGLAAAHAVGIVHRDIKPQNLIVRDDGTLKVADFGVARSADETVLTQLGSVIGTADYISPEQARGEIATPPSDLYSLGVVLFEMLTGHAAVHRRASRGGREPARLHTRAIAATGQSGGSRGSRERRRPGAREGAQSALRFRRRHEGRTRGCAGRCGGPAASRASRAAADDRRHDSGSPAGATEARASDPAPAAAWRTRGRAGRGRAARRTRVRSDNARWR